MYKVLVAFTDLQDKNRTYNVGDTFPRDGFKVSAERLQELSSTNNKRGVALIEKIGEKREEPIKVEPQVETVAEASAGADVETEVKEVETEVEVKEKKPSKKKK